MAVPLMLRTPNEFAKSATLNSPPVALTKLDWSFMVSVPLPLFPIATQPPPCTTLLESLRTSVPLVPAAWPMKMRFGVVKVDVPLSVIVAVLPVFSERLVLPAFVQAELFMVI